jgi:outer membrane immunogenic protein
MRWVICAVAVLAFAQDARAQDYVLRGSEPTYHWGGIYGGVQGGFESSTVNFGNAAASQIAFLLRNTAIEQDEQISQWNVLGQRKAQSTSLGAFLGYNVEWEDVILGLEANYNRVSIDANNSSSISRSFTDSTNLPTGHHYFYSLTTTAQSSLRMTDIATFRGRAGWEAGNFLPYSFVGLAVGRANTFTGSTLSYTAIDVPDSVTPPLTPLGDLAFGPASQSSAQNGAFAFGYAAGLGVDAAILTNVFVRGELEYIHFAPVNGIQVSQTTARVGAGLKF